MSGGPRVTRIAPGTYRVEIGGVSEIVYVDGPPGRRSAFWRGHVYHDDQAPHAPKRRGAHVALSLTAPMPATVLKILVAPGETVKKGDTILLLEAMKMELPIRAPGEATVTAVYCREGEIVQPDTVLVALE